MIAKNKIWINYPESRPSTQISVYCLLIKFFDQSFHQRVKSFDCKWWNLIHECTEWTLKTISIHFKFFLLCFLFVLHWFLSVANTCIMENEANGLTDSFVARHTTDPTLRLGLLFRNQNGSRHDQGTGMGAEVRKTEYSIAFRWREGHWYCFSGTTLRVCGRCKSNFPSPKLKLRSQLLLTTT